MRVMYNVYQMFLMQKKGQRGCGGSKRNLALQGQVWGMCAREQVFFFSSLQLTFMLVNVKSLVEMNFVVAAEDFVTDCRLFLRARFNLDYK